MSIPGTGFVSAPICLRHETGAGHPERPSRLGAILARVAESGLGAELAREEAPAAGREWLEAVHDGPHLDALEQAVAGGARVLDLGDTTVSPQSFAAALAAAGGALLAADRVVAGEWRNAFVAVRPPGHHAERARAMGFCLLNNVAICARYLQRRHGLERVAILDWDVHHGNGTQHAFERDPTVFFASLHQWPFYPGTGAADERGIGAGEGTVLNCPMPAGAGDAEYLAAFERAVLPAIEAFAPEALLISAGFDAHALDPLGGTRVSTEGFRRMSALALELAAATARGRVISLLEGGYDLAALADSVEVHLEELLRAP